MANVKVFVDKQTDQKQYAQDLSMREGGHMNRILGGRTWWYLK